MARGMVRLRRRRVIFKRDDMVGCSLAESL
jgi:hypothetical protein